jgi:putative molybdopterin biosynthesis protein
MDELFSTKEVARFLNINEKMVYSLVSDKGLPATKITGKWLFPRHLVEQWVEANTINFPESTSPLPALQGLLIVAGSNDLLLDRTLALYNRLNSGHVAVFGNLGSMGGLQALRKDLCHIASSHLLQEDENEYNFEFAFKELDRTPAVLNFCRREQGILLAKGNPKNISGVTDLGRPGVRIVNRALGTGTRLLFDKELQKAGLKGEKIKGYTAEVSRHLDVGLEILSRRADAGPGIKAVAGLLDLDFIPLRWERFDLMITRSRFFEENIQRFLGLLHEREFKDLVAGFSGYDLSLSGKMVFPPDTGDRSKP